MITVFAASNLRHDIYKEGQNFKVFIKTWNEGHWVGKLSEELNVDHYVIYSLCMEMELRNHLRVIQTTTVGISYSCHPSITPQGMYFINKGGYTYEWITNFVVDFPKNFWWLIALISYFIGKGAAK
jgi:hypothetical protein